MSDIIEVVSDDAVSTVIEVIERGPQGPVGPEGPPGSGSGTAASTFESVASNLLAYPFAVTYSASRISTVVYTLPNASTITKTINYTSGRVTSIVLSGATPSGISLTKTFTYTGDNVTGVAYS
jgi:hypothetical protein